MKQLLFIFSSVLIINAAQGQVRQRSTTQGFNAAVQAHALGWTSEYFQYLDENAGSGSGIGLRIGYGITQLIEPYLAYDWTSMSTSNVDAESFRMSHLDAGLRLNLAGTIHPVRPFVEGGYSFRKGTIKRVINGNTYNDLEFSGGTPHLGGGLSFFPKIPISLFAKGLFTVGKKSKVFLDEGETADKSDVTTFRISFGVNFNISELAQKQ